jgi:chromatin modification-related protein VID21
MMRSHRVSRLYKSWNATDSMRRGRKLNESNIPARRKPKSDVLQRFLKGAASFANENIPRTVAKLDLGNGVEPSPSPVAERKPVGANLGTQEVNGVYRESRSSKVNGNLGREPTEDVEGKSSAGKPSTEKQHNRAHSVAFSEGKKDVDSMEIVKDEKEDHSSIRPAAGDSLAPPDALSSPGSTAHSATTPAVHEESTDTSPDNEGPQYPEEDDESTEQGQSVAKGGEPSAEASGDAVASSGRDADQQPSTVNGVEEQLLRESAAARLAQSGDQSGQPAAADLKSKAESKKAESVGDEATSITKSPKKSEPATSQPLSVSVPPKPTFIDAGALVKSPSQALDSARTPISEHAIPSANTSPTAERAVTRITSGALRQRSVNELLGETPKAPVQRDTSDASYVNGERPVSSESISAVPTKSLVGKPGEKRRKSIPTVVFGKQVKPSGKSEDAALVPSRQKPGHQLTEDYFTPLFIDGFTRQSKWMKPIEQLLNQAHKTLSTSDQHMSILDHQACRILRRVYYLQQHDKWSLRQPMRCPEPTRPTSHWDVLMQEMKWMRTDFREERKWKRAVSRNLAYACAEWVAASPEERKALQVAAVIPADVSNTDVAMADVDGSDEPIPELAHTDSPIENEEELVEADALIETVAPSAIFALQDDEVIFGLRRSQASDQLLDELPLYGSPLTLPKFDLTGPELDPDAQWRRPAVPLSKYVEGQMVLATRPPPRKRSRYQYRGEDSDDEDQGKVIFGGHDDSTAVMAAENSDVALFNPIMKPIRDRLHAGHQFRPPTEHPMPVQSFYESRMASQWTLAEDDELKALVREYSYNWSLISSMISTKSTFASGAERRTPWECFERWVNLEGLPNDMSKTQYFKTYHNRIEAAQRVIKQQNETAQQQAGPNGALTPVPRRRPTTTVRVERRRNQKHLALIDAMRKLAKKRETAVQKAQHAASLAAMRKANEAQRQQTGPTKTPRDYSLMRWERDQQLAEKMAQYALRQQEALQRRARPRPPTPPPSSSEHTTNSAQALQARSQAAQAGQMPTANGTPQPPQPAQAPQLPATANPLAGAAAAAAAAARLNVPGQIGVPAAAAAAAAVAAQARPRMPMQPPPPNAALAAVQAQMTGGLVPPLPMNGLQQVQLQAMQAQVQAQAQAQAQAQHRMPMANPQADLNLVMQARRIQDQQRAAVQLQQQAHQQHHPQLVQAVQQQAQQLQQPGQPQQPLPSPQMQQANGVAQNSPTGMRTMVNGINQQNFLANAQAMMASFNAANGGGMAASPGAGLSMPNMAAGSPRPPAIPPGQMPALAAQLRELENSYRAKFPNYSQDQIRQHATEHLGRLIVQRQQQINQSAMNAAAGAMGQQVLANGMTATTSPHQYAQLLRAQQQAQAAAAQQGGPQHQRQPSNSATPVPGK